MSGTGTTGLWHLSWSTDAARVGKSEVRIHPSKIFIRLIHDTEGHGGVTLELKEPDSFPYRHIDYQRVQIFLKFFEYQ
jgi:hypothetical protein